RFTGSYHTMIDTRHGANLQTSGREKDFISRIQFCAINAPLLHGHAELIAHHPDYSVAGNALKNVFGKSWSSKFAISYKKHVRGTRFRNCPIMSEQNGFVKNI